MLLAENSESAANGGPYADQVLQAADGEAVDATEREAIASGCLLQLLCGHLGVAGALHGGEGIAQVVKLLFCSGKLVCGGFECS